MDSRNRIFVQLLLALSTVVLCINQLDANLCYSTSTLDNYRTTASLEAETSPKNENSYNTYTSASANTEWQITINRIDSSPQPSGFQMIFRVQLQVSAVDVNISENAQMRFPAQSFTTFSLPVAHPAVEGFYLDTLTNEWVVDLQDNIFAGTSIEFDLVAKSSNHITPNGTTFLIDATIDSDNSDPASASANGEWSATTNLGIEKYLQFGPDTDALLDIPVRYYLYPCDPSFTPNALGHLYLANWTLVDQLPAGVIYNNSSGTYDAGANTVTWSDAGIIENEACDFEGATDYWIEVTFPSTVFGANAAPPVLEAENTATFEGYPFGATVAPANRLFDTDALLHGFGLPNPIGSHTKSASTPYYGSQDITFEGDAASFRVNIRTDAASTTPYYFKIIDPFPCLDYTPNAATQYESPNVNDAHCANPAFKPTDYIELTLSTQYLVMPDTGVFIANNPTIPLRYEDTNGNMDTLHVPYNRYYFNSLRYTIMWTDIEAQLGVGVNISKLIWDSEDFDVQVGVTSSSLRTAASLFISGSVAEDNPPTYPMEDQYRVRNYAYFYIEAGGQEDSLGFIQDDVIIVDPSPTIRAQKTVSESSGLITLTANSVGGSFANNDTLIITDLLPFGYTFKNEAQQFIQFNGSFSWYWDTNNGDSNATSHPKLDNISVRNNIDVEVIDNYNGTGRQLVKAAFLPPPIPNVWDDLASFRFSFYLNESPMTFSAVNSMEVFPTNSTSTATLQCQNTFSSAPSAAASSDSNDLDGDGITIGDAYCADTDNIVPSSTIVNIKSYKSVRGDVVAGADFRGFPAIGDITDTGGSADFQINLQNIGGVTLENLVIYDVLPHIGDTGLSETQIGAARGSAFDATFVGIDASTLPTGTVVEYSVVTNPCRDELTTGATPFPTGCVNDWTTSLPSPASSVKALRFSFPTGDIMEFAAGEAISIEYEVTYPVGIQPGEVAWNNFAFGATRQDDNTNILPTEPPKVGIAIPQVDLSVDKSVSPTNLIVGKPATYTLKIDHDGAASATGGYTLPASTARDVTLKDNFKDLGLILVPNSILIVHDVTGLPEGVAFDTLTGVITIPEIGPEDSYTITYQAYTNTEQSIANTLELMIITDADDIDSRPGNNLPGEDDTDDATANWVTPDISIQKLVDQNRSANKYIEADATDGLTGIYGEGQPIDYRFIIKNTGDVNLSNIALTDDLTSFLCNQNIGFLAAGDSTIIDCNWSFGFVENTIPYVNTATVNADAIVNGITYPLSDTDSAAVIVVNQCTVSITQTIQNACTSSSTAGDSDYYTITFNASNTYQGGSNRYEVVLGANADGSGGTLLGSSTYGTPITVGDDTDNTAANDFTADDISTYTITIRDVDDTTCFSTYTTNVVASCTNCPPIICLPVQLQKNPNN